MQSKQPRLRIIAAMLGLIAMAVLLLVASPRPGRDTATEWQNDVVYGEGDANGREPQPDLTGSVGGIIVDDSGSPIAGIEIELIPPEKTGDERWYATKREWTNAQGVYEFPRANPGEYILAVQKSRAPDGRRPFAGTYYPEVDDEALADRIHIGTSSSLELRPLRLHRIEVVTIRVTVQFEDGTRPAWSNLLFHNPSFADQGVIGDEASGIREGKGEFTLPVGFDYYARAKVDCDAGSKIETRESRPIQRFHVTSTQFPEELTFLIPGPPCPLWSPK